MIRSAIPNLVTLANLSCGVLGIWVLMRQPNGFDWPSHYAAYLLMLAAVFDFLDGALARMLRAHSAVGKELDSLADAVTFGVLPGFMMYHWLEKLEVSPWWLPFLAFLIPLFSVYRLAKFNVDTRQTESFLGLPTPANALFFASFLLIESHGESIVLPYISYPAVVVGLILVFCLLLVSELPLLSLKFKSLAFRGNGSRYLLLIGSAVLIVLFSFTAIPFIILLYLLISVVNNFSKR